MSSANCGTKYLDACLSLFQCLKDSTKMYCKQEITFHETPVQLLLGICLIMKSIKNNILSDNLSF